MRAGIDVHQVEALGNGAGGRGLSRGRAAINGDDVESRTVWHIQLSKAVKGEATRTDSAKWLLRLARRVLDADHAEEVPPFAAADHAEVVPPLVCEQGGLTSVSTVLSWRTCRVFAADHVEVVPPLVCKQGGLTSVSTVLPRRARRVFAADHAEVVPSLVCEQGGLTSVSTVLPRRARRVLDAACRAVTCGHGTQGYNNKPRPTTAQLNLRWFSAESGAHRVVGREW